MLGPTISKSMIRRPMPDVKRFTSRKIDIPANRNSLELKLRDWIQQVLDYIGQNAPIEGVSPASYLAANADGIETLMYAPAGMSLGAATPNVYAEFVWGRRPDGRWYIRHIKFAPNLSQAALREAERRRVKDRLLGKAEAQNAQHFHARQAFFPAEQYVNTWEDEIRQGSSRLKFLIEDIYERAKEEASMPENWVRPKDIALAFISDGANLAVKSVKGTQKMASIYKTAGEEAAAKGERVYSSAAGGIGRSGEIARERAAHAIMKQGEEAREAAAALHRSVERAHKLETVWELEHKAHVGGEAVKEAYEAYHETEREGPVFQKSRVDAVADIAVDAATLIPGAGGFVKMFAGMFIDIGLANYAGVVAKIRGRIYSCFVGGFITGITLAPGSTLKHERDKKYYDLGVQKGLRLGSKVSFQYQIALLNYAMEHYTSGFWAGTTPEFHGRQASHWNYPDDWEAKWSPQLLGRSLVTMLGFKHYLIE